MKLLASIWQASWRAILRLLGTPRSCDRPGCSEAHPCDDCVAFWSIK